MSSALHVQHRRHGEEEFRALHAGGSFALGFKFGFLARDFGLFRRFLLGQHIVQCGDRRQRRVEIQFRCEAHRLVARFVLGEDQLAFLDDFVYILRLSARCITQFVAGLAIF